MGFICSAGAASTKLQREMKRGNLSACAGASLSPEATPGGDFSSTLAGLGQAAVGLQQQLSPEPVGMAALFSMRRDGSSAGRSGIVARFPLTSARLEEQEGEAVV